MKYKLTAYSETYLAEEVRLPSPSILAHQPAGHPYSFVSPIRLPLGKTCRLTYETGGYDLMVHGCFGFAYTGKFFISGVIVSDISKMEPVLVETKAA